MKTTGSYITLNKKQQKAGIVHHSIATRVKSTIAARSVDKEQATQNSMDAYSTTDDKDDVGPSEKH